MFYAPRPARTGVQSIAAQATRSKVPITPERLRGLLALPFDQAAWTDLLGADCHVRVGAREPAVGREKALRELERVASVSLSIGVGYWDAWARRGALFVETEIAVAAPLTAVRMVPCVLVVRVLRGRVRDLRFYLDTTGLPAFTATGRPH